MLDLSVNIFTDMSDIILGGFRTKFQEWRPSGDKKASLEDLFMGFLHYYKNFDFRNKSINLSLVSAVW